MMILLAITLLGLGVAGCGRGSTRSSSSSHPSSASAIDGTSTSSDNARGSGVLLMGDEDDDDTHVNSTSTSFDYDTDRDNDRVRESGYRDSDDGQIVDYGRPAKLADSRALTTVVERYYAAAAAGEGRVTCSLMLPAFARSIPESYGRPPGPPYMRGKTCPAVMSSLFKHDHKQLRSVVAVTGVRVKDDEAFVLLGSRTMPASYLNLKRYADGWRVVDLLASTLP